MALLPMPDWLRHILTETDNATTDGGKVMAYVGFIFLLAGEVYTDIWCGGKWEFKTIATGLGIYFAGVGAVWYLKKESPTA
jgi:hypothetical protein